MATVVKFEDEEPPQIRKRPLEFGPFAEFWLQHGEEVEIIGEEIGDEQDPEDRYRQIRCLDSLLGTYVTGYIKVKHLDLQVAPA